MFAVTFLYPQQVLTYGLVKHHRHPSQSRKQSPIRNVPPRTQGSTRGTWRHTPGGTVPPGAEIKSPLFLFLHLPSFLLSVLASISRSSIAFPYTLSSRSSLSALSLSIFPFVSSICTTSIQPSRVRTPSFPPRLDNAHISSGELQTGDCGYHCFNIYNPSNRNTKQHQKRIEKERSSRKEEVGKAHVGSVYVVYLEMEPVSNFWERWRGV